MQLILDSAYRDHNNSQTFLRLEIIMATPSGLQRFALRQLQAAMAGIRPGSNPLDPKFTKAAALLDDLSLDSL